VAETGTLARAVGRLGSGTRARAIGAAALLGWTFFGPGGPAVAQPVPGEIALAHVFGGSFEDSVRDVAPGEPGVFYVAGGTGSPDLPVTPGAFDTELDPRDDGGGFGAHDVFVARVRVDGTVEWCTYVGGPGYDRAYAIEVDGDRVVVAGRAGVGFPTTAGAVQTGFQGDFAPNGAYGPQDGFVLALSRDGSTLLWSTYVGGPGPGFVRDAAIGPGGDVHVAITGVQGVHPLVTPGSFRDAPPPGIDGVVARLAGDGGSVRWATYLGGSGVDLVNPSIRVDATGRVLVTGATDSWDFPTTPGAFQPALHGPSDMTLSALAPDGASMVFGTYFGGGGDEETETHSLALAPGGDVLLAATTTSEDLPGTAGALQGARAGARDGFVARFDPAGGLVRATYLGGASRDEIEGVAVDPGGEVLVTGFTESWDFPLAGVPAQPEHAGGPDLFVARLSPDLGTLLAATYLGGGDADLGRAAAVAPDGSLLVAGHTRSSDFPSTDGSLATPTSGGLPFDGRDALVVRVVPEPSPPLQLAATLTMLCTMAGLRRRRRRRAARGRPAVWRGARARRRRRWSGISASSPRCRRGSEAIRRWCRAPAGTRRSSGATRSG
jgi:hypothetical protein